jgi:hypothetical protein
MLGNEGVHRHERRLPRAARLILVGRLGDDGIETAPAQANGQIALDLG